MFGALFKPDWQSESAEKRLQAITKLDSSNSESLAVLETLATNDSDAQVRKAALAKISQPGVLMNISLSHSEPQTREVAETALIGLIGPKSQLNESEFHQLLSEQPRANILVAQYCPHANLRQSLIQDLSEIEQAKIIADVAYTDTRKLIAEQLQSQAALELARKHLKGKDKSAEKIIKSKLEQIRAEQKQAEENHALAESLCEKMEFIANHPEWRAEFKSRFVSYERDWHSLSFSPSDVLQQRYIASQKSAEAKVERQTKTELAQQAQTALADALYKECLTVANYSVERLIEERDALSVLISESLSQWLLETESEAPSLSTADTFLTAQKALKSVIDLASAASQPDDIIAFEKALKQVHWPKPYSPLLAQKESQALIDDVKADNCQARKSEKEKLDSLHKRISRLLGTSKRGDVKRAQRELTATTKIASHFEGKDKVVLDERLAQAAESVTKMADWQAFATEPKFIELCDSMEKLVDSTTHPDKLAKKIGVLQQRWKALGHSEVADQHWERFKGAADKAYEPCSAFFKQRRATQRDNLKAREPLIDRMQALLENTPWTEEPDYKEVEIELRSINNDWQKIKDVEHGPGQKQWERLSTIRASIYEKLDIVYDKNIELKNQLISQVEALLETDVKEDAIDKLQLFQNRWKKIGVTRRKQDQSAWKQFKRSSDAVYAKIQDARHGKRTEENSQLQAYRDIIKQIQLLAKSATEIAKSEARLDSLQADYQALPPLPKSLPEKLLKGLESDFNRAVSTFDKTRERLQQAEKAKVFDRLAEKAMLCAELEKLAHNAPPEKLDALRSEIAAIELNDKALSKRFKTRLDSALDKDRQQANDLRRRMCIDLEILLGVESPADDKSLRMQIQLEQMKKQGIGHSQHERNTMLDELKLDWLCLPGAEPDVQSSLDKRFQNLIAKHA